MAPPTPNTLIDGRYKVLSKLGSGGMADVFLAEDEQLSRKVALKLLHERFAADPDFVERFRLEAQAAAGLQHPNVVSVYDDVVDNTTQGSKASYNCRTTSWKRQNGLNHPTA